MKIGTVNIENEVIQAPLAGFSHLPYRMLAKKHGCGLVCSEMISANGLIHNSKNTKILLNTSLDEKPLSVQIFGSDPDIMAEASKIVQACGADILDINFGCSVKKVIKTGSGVALMKEPKKAEKIFTAVKKAISIPLTIKVRTGWDSSGSELFELAYIAEKNGVDAITVHPRTAAQGFKGKSNWSQIKEVKNRLSIPVIGNGDVLTAQDVLSMKNETGCDAVMIGRAAIGNPWIFSQSISLLNGQDIKPVSIHERYDVMKNYVEMIVDFFGEKKGSFILRGQLGHFIKGFPFSSLFREKIIKVSSKIEALKILENIRENFDLPCKMKE